MASERDGDCYFCGKPISSLSGNPSLWPCGPITGDEPGKVAPAHTGCVMERLTDRDRFKAFIASIPGPQDRGHGLIRCGTCGWYAGSHSPDCLHVKAQAVLRGEDAMTDYPEYICAPCGKKYGRGWPEGHIATFHTGRCDICGQDGVEVTEPRDYGGLDWEKVKREKGIKDETQ